MGFSTWDILFNSVLLLFWFRLWNEDDREVLFNPYLSQVARWSDAVVKFLQPVFLSTPPRLVALAAVAFLICFRGFMFHGIGLQSQASWRLVFGFEAVQAHAGRLPRCILFSAFSFGILLFQVWGVSLLYASRGPGSTLDRTTAALHYLSRPFTAVTAPRRPFVLLACGFLLAACLNWLGGWRADPLPVRGVRYLISAVTAWADLLAVIRSLMIILIIGSWVSMFTHSRGLQVFCRDWIDLFLGPMRRFPIRLGMIDLSPIVFFFLIGMVHALLRAVFYWSYTSLGAAP